MAAAKAVKLLTAEVWMTARVARKSGVGTFIVGTSRDLGVGKGFDLSGTTDMFKLILAPGTDLFVWTNAPSGRLLVVAEPLPLLMFAGQDKLE